MQAGTFRKFTLLLGVATVFAFIGGCKKQVASAPPTHAAPAPAAAQPTVTLSASPSTINPGDSTTLSWTSTDATDADIEPGVGKVAVQGSTPVNPTSSTTYTITATGPGGTATATTRVTVSAGRCRSSSLQQSKHERTVRAERERRLLRFQQSRYSPRRSRPHSPRPRNSCAPIRKCA